MHSVPTACIWTNVSCSVNKENYGPWNSPFSKYHKLVTQMPQKLWPAHLYLLLFLSNSCTAYYNYRFGSHQGRGRVLSALEFKSISFPETNTGERSEFAIYCNVAEGSLAFSQKARDKNNSGAERQRDREQGKEKEWSTWKVWSFAFIVPLPPCFSCLTLNSYFFILHRSPSLSLSVGLCGGAVSSDQRDNKLSLHRMATHRSGKENFCVHR